MMGVKSLWEERVMPSQGICLSRYENFFQHIFFHARPAHTSLPEPSEKTGGIGNQSPRPRSKFLLELSNTFYFQRHLTREENKGLITFLPLPPDL